MSAGEVASPAIPDVDGVAGAGQAGPAPDDSARLPPSGTSRWMAWVSRCYFVWLVPASLILGAVLRTREWLYDKSLWLDEITVTNQLASRTFGGLLKPLGGNQGGPVGWLWAERASIDLFGVHELALRLVPWLASLVALGVFPLVCRRLLGRVVTPTATLLFATSPALIFYAAETKQYSSDTMCALLAVLVTLWLLDRTPDLRTGLLWGLACGALTWSSQPAILVTAACALSLIVRWARNRRALGSVLCGAVLLGLCLAAEWFVTLRQQSANDALQAYWQKFGGYPPTNASLRQELSWLWRTFSTFVQQVAHLSLPVVAAVLALWGLATLIRRRPWQGMVVGIVLLAAVGAAVTRHYPLADRLALYLLPLLLPMMAAGLADADRTPERRLPGRWSWPVVVLCILGLAATTAPAVVTGVSKLVQPDERTAGRQAVEFVGRHRQPSDLVLTDRWGLSTVYFYGPRNHVSVGGVFSFPAAPAGCRSDPLAPLAHYRRVWLLFAHHPSDEPADRTEIYRSQLAARATLVTSFAGAGDAGAYLYDLSLVPTSPAPPLPRWSKNGCFTITNVRPK